MIRTQWKDDFEGSTLLSFWTDAYLPAWSSRAAARAHVQLADSVLRLSIPTSHPVWCERTHQPPIRVSGIQSGNWSGPVGSRRGQQPFRDGLVVKEVQPEHWGWTPCGGLIEVRARMNLSPRSMASAWLIGREIDPVESAEICVFEVFGRDISNDGIAKIGNGLHAFRDPRVTEDFEQIPIAIDVQDWHTYAIRWQQNRLDILIEGNLIRSCTNPPWYPMQMELAVFDFPEWATGEDDQHVPWFEIDWISEGRL